MDPPPRADVICLHLAEHADQRGAETVPAAVSPAGIAAAVGMDDERIGDRLSLLSTLDRLKGEGLIEEAVRTVADDGGRRNVYFPTRSGLERAAAVRERIAEEPVVVSDGSGAETVPLERAAGYFEGQSVVSVLARLDDDGRLDLADGDDREFVDREGVLATFDEALDATREQGSRTLLVAGSAGVGKTAIVDEVADRAAEAGFEVLRGASRRDVLDPYGPVRRAFEGSIGGGVVERLAAAESDDLEDAAAFEAGRNALFYEVRETVTERATERPLLVAVDDLQWADQPTLELFAYLAESITQWIYPVLFVAAYRSEAVRADGPLSETLQRLTASDRVEAVELEPLPRHHTRSLLSALTGDPAVPDAFVDHVQRTTGGNPLFVRATVSQLLDEGVVDPPADRYPADGAVLDVPAAVREAVEERLTTLDDRGRRVLRAGSVLGETVPRALLVSVLDLPEPDVLEYADLLVGASIWERVEGGYRFDSGVIREAVLSAIPDEVAAELHEAAAARLAARDGAEAPPAVGSGDGTAAMAGDGGDQEAAIARHYEAAGDGAAALEHYRRAGDRAESMYAHEVAREAYGNALELAGALDDPAAAADLLERRGEVRFLLGDFEAAAGDFERLRERTDDPGAAVRAHHRGGEIRVKQGDYEAALEHADAGLAVAERDAVPQTDRCGLLRMRGWAQMQRGDLEAARETFRRERTAAEAADDDVVLGVALHDLGTVAGKSGETAAAEDHLAAAVERLEGAGDRRHLAKALTNLALVHRHLGDLDAATGEIRRALDIQRELGVEEGLPTTLLNLGVVHEARGNLDAAIERYREGLDAARRIGREQKAANGRTDLAAALLAVGEVEAARDHAERAVAACEAMGHGDGETMAGVALARVQLVGGDREAARRSAERALAVAREVGNKDRVGDALAVRGRIHRLDGDPEAARECHEEGLALMAESGNAGLAIANRVGLAGDDQATGDLAAALEHAEAALADVGHDDVLASRVRTRVGAVRRERGEYDAAGAALERALEIQRERGARTDEARTLLELAELALGSGDPDGAREHVGAAAETATECGATLYVRRADALRERL